MGILNKKMPSLLGIAIIAAGVITTTILVNNSQSFQINASPGEEPKNIEKSNITSSSFTLTYTTDESVIGSLNLGESPDNLNLKFLDDRDKNSQNLNSYNTHYISATNLKPETTYYYTITSSNETFSNNGSPFTLNTGAILDDEVNSQAVVTGKVIMPDGTNPTEGIAIIKINGAQTVSSPVDKNGQYSIPLKNLRTFDLKNYYSLAENIPVNLEILSLNLRSQISLSTNQISEIPLITLSNNYDFSELDSETLINTRSDVKFPEFNSSQNNSTLQKNPTKIISPSIKPTVNP